ncbi:MAG TPA: tetratricopeptide repeat protein [Verrucomicrobiae bacterium]|nr:tetratricopeptide repeat protein [Verrucomicrobiae bacterium]
MNFVEAIMAGAYAIGAPAIKQPDAAGRVGEVRQRLEVQWQSAAATLLWGLEIGASLVFVVWCLVLFIADFPLAFLAGICKNWDMPEKTLNELVGDLRRLYTRGTDALQRENYDYAIEMFTLILNKEPGQVEVRRALRTAQTQKAGAAKGGFLGFTKRVFSGAGSSPLIAKGHLALRNNPIEAIQIAEQIIAHDAYSSPGHTLLADAAMAAEFPQTAVLSLEVLAKNAPKDKELNLKFADALAAAGQKSVAEKVLVDLRREHPNDNEIFMALKNISARKTMDEGAYSALKGGEGSFRDALKNKEEAVSLEQEKRQVKAEDISERLIREYEARLKTEPNNLKLYRDLGDLYAQRNQFDRALSYYEKITATDAGNDASLQSKIAQTKVRKFDYALSQLDPNALDYAEKAEQIKVECLAFRLDECKQRAERYPTDLQIRFEYGQLLFDMGKIGEAIPEFQKAINNPNRRTQSMGYLAQCFARRGMNDLAAKKLQEALKEKPAFDDEKKDLTYNLGLLLEKMGKKEEAIEQFKQVYEIDSAYKDVQKKIDDYYAGS